MEKQETKAAIIYDVAAIVCFGILALTAIVLCLEGASLIDGQASVNISTSSMFGFTVVVSGLVFLLLAERTYVLLEKAKTSYVRSKEKLKAK